MKTEEDAIRASDFEWQSAYPCMTPVRILPRHPGSNSRLNINTESGIKLGALPCDMINNDEPTPLCCTVLYIVDIGELSRRA